MIKYIVQNITADRVPSAWTSCAERMPEERDTQYLCRCSRAGDWLTQLLWYDKDGNWYTPHTLHHKRPFNMTQYVTHWMPLPEPPAGESEMEKP